MRDPWCVKYREIDGSIGWCATYRGRRPSDDAWTDTTRCGFTVTLRIGSDRRTPTCKLCLAKMKTRAK